MIKIPDYRFKNYTEPWEEKKLGEIVERITRKNKNLESDLPLTISAQYGLIDQETFFNKKVASKDVSGYYLLKKGEFAYNKSYSSDYPWGAVKRLDNYEMGVLSTLYIVFRPNSIDSDFLAVYYDSPKWYKEVSMRAAEGARNHGLLNISPQDFFDTELIFPVNQSEQTAIGSFFQDIDQLISLQQRKLEVLKEQKKTYLKLLFPAKGQTKPALRFAGFEDDWKEVKLGEVAELKRGLTYKPTSVVENGIRVLRSSNIDGDVFKKQEDDVFVEDSSVTIPYVQFGDILITAANGSSKLVGKHAIIEDSEKMVHGGFMLLARSKQYKFLNALLSSEWYSRFIDVSVAGGNGAIGNLSKSNLEKEIVLCPTIPEQEAIGSFFQDLDKAIAKQEEKVNQLKESKQTLLRKMFI
ncbi:restriction endonuclease subunit S [Streptococcus sp. 27098_8_22]|uniref:restriction endonuclease subunit S n=1 Tax=Streptococcus sp. 27098_8_22 TaxID=3003665 RepID=UPI00352EA620